MSTACYQLEAWYCGSHNLPVSRESHGVTTRTFRLEGHHLLNLVRQSKALASSLNDGVGTPGSLGKLSTALHFEQLTSHLEQQRKKSLKR